MIDVLLCSPPPSAFSLLRRSTCKGLTLPQHYNRTLPAWPDAQWDFSSFIPDALVINLGACDYMYM